MKIVFIVAGLMAVPAVASEPYTVNGDAIERSLTGKMGDAARGKTLIANRQRVLCLLCHTGPFPEPHMQGNLAPNLRDAAGSLSPAQLRLRLVDMRRVNPGSVMPAFYRADGFTRIGQTWRGQTILSAEQIEDVIAYLVTLQEKR